MVSSKARKRVPFEFVLDALAEGLSDATPLRTNPMFGCLAVYVGPKIVLILRDRPTARLDNGVWLATKAEHHAGLRHHFPSMRSVGIFGKKITDWQVLPADSPDFETAALRAVEFILAGDPRIGKIPKEKSARAKRRKKTRG
ncbi:MAG TPA: hypothetical protein VMT51_01670 [Dongiaceae bacterium]|nr:hypothetical protein [Dongiaceae bacterium]